MNHLIWLAFEESALSAARMLQIRALSQILRAQIVVLTDSLYADKIQLPDAAVVIRDDIISKLMNPPQVCLELSHLFTDYAPSAILAPHSPRWLRILSTLAASAQMPLISGMMTRCLPDCARTICAGRVVETLPAPTRPFIATLTLDEPRQTDECWPISGHTFTLEDLVDDDRLVFWPVQMAAFTPFISDTVPLDTARLVFAGGRGLGTEQNFKKLACCAEKFGAALAASRLAVDLGWCSSDLQVGQTGRAVAPEIYVAFGISGAIQHLAGIQNARTIIAINSDKDAPIFQYANYGIVADVNQVLDSMARA